MVKTNKKKVFSKNKTNKKKKNQNSLVICPIGLKPFEKNLEKIHPNHLKAINHRKHLFVKELMSNFAPPGIKPYDDFYDYINYQWLQNVSLDEQQKYIVQVDDFRLAQDKVYRELHGIILEYIKNNNNKLSRNMKNYYKSVIEMNSVSYSKILAKEAEKMVENIINEDNPWKMLAVINKDEMISFRAPFVWSVNPDEKNININRCYVEPHQFTLVDFNVYYNDGTDVKYKENYRKKYAKYCKRLFDTTLGPNNYEGFDVFDVEIEILNALECIKVTSKEEKSYNKVTADEALNTYGFDWKEFTTHLGFKKPPEFFITSSLNYLKCGSELLIKNWKTPKWKSYWVWILVKQLARITKKWEHLTYEFSGSFEKGQEKINVSNAVSATLYMSIPFNTFLTNQYIAKYENPQVVEFVKILANDIKIVFERIIKVNTWLQPSTKEYALKKLKYFKFIFGKPENLNEDPDLEYSDILYDNLKKLMEWRNKRFIELEGKSPVDMPMMDWSEYPVKMVGSQAYIVNASYTPSKNSIYINAGYLQKPFVDLDERGIEYNLANIGYTIGHEMGHSLDDLGSQYGYDGNLNDWWTEKDKKKYKQIQDDVIKQYEEFAARDGIKFDASIGIGEDLADITGMHICDEYLRDFQDNNKDLIPIRQLSYESYYTYFAFEQKQLVKKRALSAQLKTNPHPLDKYRCNVPLSRSYLFRSIYNVKKGDGMWWHNTNMIW
jgi:predicted metalloendopeptidase